MAEIYLTPSDISATDTRLVLAFLNTVTTADEIASRVEIPNEIDVGVRLGQRILDFRTEIGGRFSNLDELLSVPLIGPERFTEIVTEALHKTALEILSSNVRGNADSQILAVASQLESLRGWASELESLNPNRYRIEVKSLDQTPFLGEVIPVRIRAWDRIRRTYKANLPLTIETNWGTLRWEKGLQVKQGNVITGRTGVSGELLCHLYTPTVEPLTLAQQNELSLALGKLVHGTELPDVARASFVELVENYKHPLNRDLRGAVDIHYKSRQHRVAESVNLPASVYSWIYEQALVRVYAHPQEAAEASTVLSMSALTIEYRDWLSPWYQIYKESLVENEALQSGLSQALAFSEDEHGLIGHMVSNLHSFIAQQHGLIGERIGQQASKEVLTHLLRNTPAALSANAQASLYTILTQAPSSVTAANKGSVGVANEVALDVGRNTGIIDGLGDLGNLSGMLEDLQGSYNGIDSRLGNLESVTGNINFDQLTSDLEAFNSNYANFSTNYASFQDNYSSFNANYASFNSDYSTFNSNYSNFNNNYSNFNNSYANFNSNYASFNSNYTNFNNNYADFDNRYGTWVADFSEFNTRYDNFGENYGSFQESLVSFNQTKDQLIANVTEGVNAALRTVERDVSGATGGSVVIAPIENVNLRRNFNDPTRGGG